MNRRISLGLLFFIISNSHIANCKTTKKTFCLIESIVLFEKNFDNFDNSNLEKNAKDVVDIEINKNFTCEYEDSSFLYRNSHLDKIYSLQYYCKTRELLNTYRDILIDYFPNLEILYNGVHYTIILKKSTILSDLINDYITHINQFPSMVLRKV